MSLGGGFTSTVNTPFELIADGVTSSWPRATTTGRLQRVTRQHARRADRRRDHLRGPPGVVLQLGHLPRPVRARIPGPLGAKESDTARHIVNGTSQAAPHVAGVVATYLQATAPRPRRGRGGRARRGHRRTRSGPRRLTEQALVLQGRPHEPVLATACLDEPGRAARVRVRARHLEGLAVDHQLQRRPPTPRTGSCNGWLGGYVTPRPSSSASPVSSCLPPRYSTSASTSRSKPKGRPHDRQAVRPDHRQRHDDDVLLLERGPGLARIAGYVQYACPLAAYAGQRSSSASCSTRKLARRPRSSSTTSR